MQTAEWIAPIFPQLTAEFASAAISLTRYKTLEPE